MYQNDINKISFKDNLSNDNIFRYVQNLSNSSPQVIYQHVLTSLKRIPYLSYSCWTLCDLNKQVGWVCVFNLSGKPCNLQDKTAGPSEALIKASGAKRE